MNITAIIVAAVVIGAIGCLIAVMLNIASDKFHVDVDEKVTRIRDVLPGNNCGGCGFAGCDALAAAIVDGSAPPNGCPICSNLDKISEILGVEVEEKEKMVAFVKCGGTCEKAKNIANYLDVKDCIVAASAQSNGGKGCVYGCMGFGTCVKACQFDAIHIIDGIAVVDREKCVSCGKCVTMCPKKLIELVPYNSRVFVKCNSQDKGIVVKQNCTAGCIGCTLCTKQCQFDAIHMNGNVAQINYDNCTACGKCAQKCPVNAIKILE